MDLEGMPSLAGHADFTTPYLLTTCLLWNLTSSWGSEGIQMPIGVDLDLDCIGKWMKEVKSPRPGHQHGWEGRGNCVHSTSGNTISIQCMDTILVWKLFCFHSDREIIDCIFVIVNQGDLFQAEDNYVSTMIESERCSLLFTMFSASEGGSNRIIRQWRAGTAWSTVELSDRGIDQVYEWLFTGW